MASLYTSQTPATSLSFGPFNAGPELLFDVAGSITHVSWYKGGTGAAWGEAGAAVQVGIYTTAGVQLGTGSATAPVGTTGRVNVALGTPVTVTAGQTLVAVMNMGDNNSFRLALTTGGATAALDNAPIHRGAGRNMTTGVNGTVLAFPTGFTNDDYFVDVVFTAGGGGGGSSSDAPPPRPRGVVGIAGKAWTFPQPKSSTDAPYTWGDNFKTSAATAPGSAVNLLIEGDSETEGQGATSYAATWHQTVLANLRALYGGAGAGGRGTRPVSFATYGTDSGTWAAALSATKSGFTDQTSFGLGGRGGQATGAGTLDWTSNLQGTGVDINYTDQGSFTYAVDGGGATTVTTGGTGAQSGTVRVPLGSTGAHSLNITRVSGTVQIGDLTEYDGDENAGFHLYVNAHTGWVTGQFNGTPMHTVRVPPIQPDLFIINWGTNDYLNSTGTPTQVAAAFTQAVAEINAAWPRCEILHWISYGYGTGAINPATNALGFDWPAYVNALLGVTTANMRKINLYAEWGTSTNSGRWSTDWVHMSNTGHADFAARIMQELASSVGKTLTDTGTGTDALSVTATAGLTETGTGADALTVAATTALADTVAGADALTVGAAVPLADTGTGADTVTVAAAAALADVGTAVEALTVNVAVNLTDTATGLDALSVATGSNPSLGETGTGTDALTITATFGLADTGSATDALTVAAAAGLTDTGTSSETLAVTAATALSETGHAADLLTLIAALAFAETIQITEGFTVDKGGSTPVVTPLSRTVTVSAETRSVTVPASPRTTTVPAESRQV